MNRDFEIKQLVWAFRGGIMSEAAFEEELSRLELETGAQGPAASSRLRGLRKKLWIRA